MKDDLFPDVSPNPDALMEMPVGELLRRLDRRLRRRADRDFKAREPLDRERLARRQSIERREFDWMQAAGVALRTRALEVGVYAAAHRIRCRPDDVRENPFLVACAILKVIRDARPKGMRA